jgi:hypothetical protein
MLRRMALARTDVSEERITCIIRVTRIGELGTMLAVTSNRNTLRTTNVSDERIAFIRIKESASLTLFLPRRFLPSRWWRRHVPTKQEPHGVTSQKTALFIFNLLRHGITYGTGTNKKNSVTFSPQAKYTDRATATFWRNLVPTFADRGVSRGQRSGSLTVVNLSILDQSRYISFK